MTETTAEIKKRLVFEALVQNDILAGLICKNMRELGIERVFDHPTSRHGSTDFGNVSRLVPSALVYIGFCGSPGHSTEWLKAGKSELAERCLSNSARTLAAVALDLIENPDLIRQAKEEWMQRVS